MASAQWDDAPEIKNSPYANKSISSSSSPVILSHIPSHYQHPLVSPYMPAVYPYMYPTQSHVAYSPSSSVAPSILQVPGPFVLPFPLQVSQPPVTTPGQPPAPAQANIACVSSVFQVDSSWYPNFGATNHLTNASHVP